MFIIIKFIANKPLKPSIKLAPLITNKKHNNTNIEENMWLDIKAVKNGISIYKILIGKKYIDMKRSNIILKPFNTVSVFFPTYRINQLDNLLLNQGVQL